MSIVTPNQLRAAPGHEGFTFAREIDARIRAQSPVLAEPVCAHENALADHALREMRRQGVDFGDLRLGRDHYRYVATNDTNLAGESTETSCGIGVRVLVGGFWGFASTGDLTEAGIARCVARAASLARAVGAVTPRHLGLDLQNFAAEPPHQAEFHTPVGICPLEAPTEALSAPLLAAAEIGLAQPGITRIHGGFTVWARRRLFASTEGARILTTHCTTGVDQVFTAVANGTSAYRTLVSPGKAGGLEHFLNEDFPGKAAEACREALLKCHARQPAPGAYDLILDGHHLALTMHESVGHPTELDRILGYELSLAGASFATPDKLRTFRYGSPLVNFTADNTLLFGAASQGYDDEGVECQRFPIIQEGILVGFGASRETAHQIGMRRANGTTRAEGWADVPIVRIPNLYLEPGREKLSRDELIANTKNGILMLGRDSFSIDQMRYNFQFGADMCYRIENGRITEPLRDVIYQSITPDFWGACDAICDASEWQMHGIMNCGKGHPEQTARMMHGASPARFRGIKVGF